MSRPGCVRDLAYIVLPALEGCPGGQGAAALQIGQECPQAQTAILTGGHMSECVGLSWCQLVCVLEVRMRIVWGEVG